MSHLSLEEAPRAEPGWGSWGGANRPVVQRVSVESGSETPLPGTCPREMKQVLTKPVHACVHSSTRHNGKSGNNQMSINGRTHTCPPTHGTPLRKEQSPATRHTWTDTEHTGHRV